MTFARALRARRRRKIERETGTLAQNGDCRSRPIMRSAEPTVQGPGVI